MIENLRKYSGLMIVALVAVFAGLIFLVAPSLSRGGGGRGQPYMKIGDRTYSYDEFTVLGKNSLQLAQEMSGNMGRGGDMKMGMMVNQLAGNMWQPDINKFFINRILIRQAQDKFGVHPSDQEVLDYIRKDSIFARDGEFDQDAYNEFISKRIGRLGLNEKNVQDLVRDCIAYEKLFEIIGSGLLSDFDYARRFYADQNQKLDLDVIGFPLSKHQGSIDPTEEAIKTFWEENQDAYTTEAQRKFSYLVLMPASKTAEPTDANPNDQPADAKPGATDTAAPERPADAEPGESDSAAPEKPAGTEPGESDTAAPEKPADAEPGESDTAAPEKPADAEPATPSADETPAPSTDSTAPDDTTTETEAPETEAPAPPVEKPVPAPAPAPAPVPAPAPAPALVPAPDAPAFKPLPTGEPAAPAVEDPAAVAKKAAEEQARKEAELELAGEVDTFLGELEDSSGANFEDLAKDYGWTVKKSELFTGKELPSDLNHPIRNTQKGRDMAFYLFTNLVKTADPISIFTPAIPITDGGWVIARLDGEDPAHPKSYKEARAEARSDLIRQLATEAMKKEAEDVLAKLKKAVVDDAKPFDEAAKELKLEVKSYKDFARGDRPDGMIEPQQIFDASARVDPGHFADIVHLSDRSLIIFVAKRTLVREENLQTRIEGFADNLTTRNRYIAFNAWLADGNESVKMLTRQN